MRILADGIGVVHPGFQKGGLPKRRKRAGESIDRVQLRGVAPPRQEGLGILQKLQIPQQAGKQPPVGAYFLRPCEDRAGHAVHVRMGLKLVHHIRQGGSFQHAVAVQIDDVFSLAVVKRQIHRPGLALFRVHPLHAQVRKTGLALGKYGKALVLAPVIDQKNPDALPRIGAVIDGFDAGGQRIGAVVHRNDQRNLRVETGPGRHRNPSNSPLQQHHNAAEGGQNFRQHRNDNPSAPEDKGIKNCF